MHARRLGFVGLLVGMFSLAVVAEQPARTHEIVADDYFSIAGIAECSVSPDGGTIAYVELRWDKAEDERNADIWIVQSKTGKRRRLTFDIAGDSKPRWGSQNRWIYFLSAREREGDQKAPYDGTTQVWRVDVGGTGLMPVTRVADGIGDFEMSKDGRTIYYTVGDEVVDDVWQDLRKTYDSLKYGHGVDEFSELWKLDLESWRSEKVVDDNRVIREFAVGPNERRIAMLTTPTEKLITNEGQSRVDVYDVETKSVTTLEDRLWRDNAPSPYGWLEALAWTADGDALAFGVSFDGYPSEVFVAEFGEAGINIQKLRRDGEITFVPDSGLEWRGGGRDLLVRGEWKARAYVYSIADVRGSSQGETLNLTPGDVCVNRFDATADGKTVSVIMSTPVHPPDLFVVTGDAPDARISRVTNINPQVDTWKLPQMRIVEWVSDDGTPVEGILELPPDYEPGAPLPMIVEIHGGPTAASMFRMRFWIYGRVLMPSKGYALLSPNYRGSTGFGDKFLTDLIGHKNDRDVADILAGVDAMVERGIADPDRLGVMGWSNGGYLTNCLITKTTRFKAASSGAGVLDVIMQWGTEDTPGHVVNFQQGFPWNNTDQMLAASPLFDLDKVRTPTLIHVGENDPRCPPGNSKTLYRALHEYLNVPSELVVYPGEGHGLTKYTHRKAKMAWDLQWFERYLRAPDGDAGGDTDGDDAGNGA